MSKIIGNTTATPVPRSNWLQTDESKADFILNKPELSDLATKDTVEKSDLSSEVQGSLAKAETAIQSLDGYAKKDEVAAAEHNHDDIYYKESEIDELLTSKADSNHNHSYNDLTDKPTIPSIDGLATESYVDGAIGTLNTEVASKASQVSVDNIQTQLDNLVRVFIGTQEQYETANANGEIPVNALVIITDDETSSGGGSGDSSDSTSSILGKGVLGYLILG